MNGELKRTLGLRDLVIYGLCMISPLCLYLVYGSVAQASFGMVPLVYLIGTILMLFTAFSYISFSREIPSAGSIYAYISKGINSHVGFVSGWVILGYYIAVPALTSSLSASWLSSLVPGVPAVIWVILLIGINTLMNVRGLQLGVKINYILLAIQVLSILAFFVFGIKYVFIDGHGTGGFSLNPILQPNNLSWNFISTAVSIAVVGFLGLDGLSTLSEEAKNPKRNIGLAMICTLLLIGGVYLFQGYLTGLIHPNYEDLNSDLGMFDISKEIGGSVFFSWMIVVNVLAFGIACASGLQTALSRIIYTMSRDGLLPSFLSKTKGSQETPVNAAITTGMIALVTAIFVPITTILMFLNYGAVTAYGLLNLSAIIYFAVKLKRTNTFRNILAYVVSPLIGFIICGFVWSGFDQTTIIAGICWMIVGIAVGAVASRGYTIAPKIKDL